MDFLIVVLVTVFGVVGVRTSLEPMSAALAAAERRYRWVVDALREGVLLQNGRAADGRPRPLQAHQ